MADEDELPPIHVRMGNHNQVGHIGHIVFKEPPPDPNSIWHNGIVIGTFSPDAHMEGEGYIFPKLFTDRRLGEGDDIEIQGVKLRLMHTPTSTCSSIGGRPPQWTLWNVTCKMIG